MADETIEIEVQISWADYLAVNVAVLRRKIYTVIGSVLVIFVSLSFVIFLKFGQEDASVWFFVGVLSIVTIFTLSFAFTIYSTTKRAYKSTQLLKEKIFYSFSDSGVDEKSSLFEAHLEWRIFTKAEELGSSFFIYTGDFSGHIVPFKAFKSGEQISDFRALLKRVLGDKANLRAE